MLLLLRTKRGRCEAPGLRRLTGSSLNHEVAFAFTAPLGLGNPMTRTHVRLLGPCFKTGRRRRRPTRNRDASRASKGTRCTSLLSYPPTPEPETEGSQLRRTTNFTPALGPALAVRCVNERRSAAVGDLQTSKASLRIAQTGQKQPSA